MSVKSWVIDTIEVFSEEFLGLHFTWISHRLYEVKERLERNHNNWYVIHTFASSSSVQDLVDCQAANLVNIDRLIASVMVRHCPNYITNVLVCELVEYAVTSY